MRRTKAASADRSGQSSSLSTDAVHLLVIGHCEPQMKNGETDLIDRLGRLFVSAIGSDIKFIVQGKEIPAHSVILHGSSPVFDAMFEHDMTEASNRSVTVEDTEPDVFRQLLQYLYTGDAPDLEEEDMAELLFVAADKYQIDSLKDWCSSILINKIGVENVVRLLAIAHLHSDEKMKKFCLCFVVRNRTVFWGRDDFKQLSKNYPDIFYEATKRMMDSHPGMKKIN